MTIKSRNSHHHRNDLSDDVEKIKAALAQATFDVKGKASDLFSQSIDNIKDHSSKFQENVSEFTTEKPLKSLGIALLTGIVLGYFLHKK
jgi:ElaB/YqjD/DUF883 family membrane-anchored ribosome-binding protein